MSLRNRVMEKCRSLDIPLVGVASVERWEDEELNPWMPEEFYPRSIYPEARSVLVIGLPVDLPIIETTPSIWYHELYRTVNRLLDHHGYRMAHFLGAEGHPSLWVPRDGYGDLAVLEENPVAFFSHRHAAYLAGLGNFGINNMLLTPEYGPRVRFTSILTTAKLPQEPMVGEELCNRCLRCVDQCPVNALDERDYPEGITDVARCLERSEELRSRHISPCGLCIKVCPVGRDREHYHRPPELYTEGDEELERAWKHVRSYGGK
ncbi:MAG: 4Fe-4S binding protein [Methanomassiliicoccales archaeon]